MEDDSFGYPHRILYLATGTRDMNDTLSNGMGGWWLIVSHIPMCNAAESTSWCPPRVGDRMFLLAKDITF